MVIQKKEDWVKLLENEYHRVIFVVLGTGLDQDKMYGAALNAAAMFPTARVAVHVLDRAVVRPFVVPDDTIGFILCKHRKIVKVVTQADANHPYLNNHADDLFNEASSCGHSD